MSDNVLLDFKVKDIVNDLKDRISFISDNYGLDEKELIEKVIDKLAKTKCKEICEIIEILENEEEKNKNIAKVTAISVFKHMNANKTKMSHIIETTRHTEFAKGFSRAVEIIKKEIKSNENT